MTLIESLQNIPDFRRKQGRRYPLTTLLLITIMSIISGRCRYREIAAFAKANQEEFLTYFDLVKRKRLASHVTFREVIKGVDFDKVNTAFQQWAGQYVTLEPEEWLAVDGKALGSTVTDYDSKYQNFVSLVSVFSHKRGQVLGTAKLENMKSSEIPTVQDLIATLNLHGVIFTLDALHCQKKPSKSLLTAETTI